MIEHWLTRYGRQPWHHIQNELAGCTCAWADLDGFHEEPAETLPAGDPPLATHLWAWNHHRLWRLRIDGTHTITARLDLTTPEPDPQHPTEPVLVTERHSPTWPDHDFRVSVNPRWRGRAVTLYDISGLMPLTFARLSTPPQQPTIANH